LVTNQRIDVQNTKWNTHFVFVIPENAKPGFYIGKLEAFNREGDHIIRYLTFTVK